MNSSGPIVKISGLGKKYGDLTAVDSLDLEIMRGEILGLLGHNGSGKSTTMSMIMGLVKHNVGYINVFGHDVVKNSIAIRRKIGYVPETLTIYEFLTTMEFLELTGDIYGMSQTDKREMIGKYIKAFDILGRENDLISSYSDGTKQKVAIISALIHKPDLLVLDEPLRGLDPKSSRIVKELLIGLSNQGVTIIISMHVLEIAQAMCSRIAIMDHGKLLATGTMDELRTSASMPDSPLEDIFLKLTGQEDVAAIVEALTK